MLSFVHVTLAADKIFKQKSEMRETMKKIKRGGALGKMV